MISENSLCYPHAQHNKQREELHRLQAKHPEVAFREQNKVCILKRGILPQHGATIDTDVRYWMPIAHPILQVMRQQRMGHGRYEDDVEEDESSSEEEVRK